MAISKYWQRGKNCSNWHNKQGAHTHVEDYILKAALIIMPTNKHKHLHLIIFEGVYANVLINIDQ